MPRGKRKTSREKLEELRETIASQEAQLKELRQREKELLKQQKEEELRRLARMMEEQQVSADKLAEILKGSPPLPRRSLRAREILKSTLREQNLKQLQTGAGLPDSVFFNGICDKISAGFQLLDCISHGDASSGCLDDFYVIHAVPKGHGIL